MFHLDPSAHQPLPWLGAESLLEDPFSAMARGEGAAEDVHSVRPSALSLHQNLSTSL